MHHAAIKKEQNTNIIELSSSQINLKIAIQLGFNLFSLKFNGQETIYFNDKLEDYAKHNRLAGIPFMHPWANRLNGNKIFNQPFVPNKEQEEFICRDANHLPLHGLLLKSNKWETIKIESLENKAICIAKFSFENDNLLNIFPFKHDIFLTIQLQEDTLSYIVEISNKSNNPMPICWGFHPYFKIDNSCKNLLSVPDATVAEVDKKLIPTQNFTDKNKLFPFKNNILKIQNQHIDHAFIHSNQDDKYKLITQNYQIQFNLDDHYKVVQIYHPDKVEKPYICIEPMTTLANALNYENYSTVSAGINFKAEFSMRFITQPL